MAGPKHIQESQLTVLALKLGKGHKIIETRVLKKLCLQKNSMRQREIRQILEKIIMEVTSILASNCRLLLSKMLPSVLEE